MDHLKKKVFKLKDEFRQAYERAGVDDTKRELDQLNMAMSNPNFWSDPRQASDISRRQAALESRVRPWLDLERDIAEISEMIEISDASMLNEVDSYLDKIVTNFTQLKKLLRYSGEYDHHDAIFSIYAGAGGTDAQDWAQMLERMYLRWMEQAGFKTSIIDRSAGDGAGIKSVTIEVQGGLAYGKLKNEHGVHRLVRLSPFNADNLRQTSFAKVEVLPRISGFDQVQIDEKDIKVDVYRAGGHGGQSVNTTDSAVRLTHIPTGVTVSIQNERSQLQNKETAMTILKSRLVQLQMEQHLERLSDIKGVNQSAEWGNQIRNYVLHPYKLVKDLRSGVESSSVDAILDGRIDEFIEP